MSLNDALGWLIKIVGGIGSKMGMILVKSWVVVVVACKLVSIMKLTIYR